MSSPKKGVAYDFTIGLIDSADTGSFKANPTLATGDFQVSKDNGAYANLATLPTVSPAGSINVKVVLSATEMTADKVIVKAIDVAGAEWDDVLIFIDATAANVDDLTRSTTPANTLDINATGEAGGDIVRVGGDIQSATDLKDFADAGYDPATNKVEGVKLADTTTTNTDMRGTDSALLAASAPANFSDLAITVTTGLVDITQTAADKVWSTAARTLTSFGTLVSDIWSNASRTLTAFSTSLAVSVWDVLESAIATASSIGLKLKTNLDATITSRQPSGAVDLNADQSSVTIGTTTVNTDMRGTDSAALASEYTAARAAFLDNLDISELVAGVSDIASIISAISGLNDLTALEVEDAVWDAVLTGASHNDPTSAGRRLRQLSTLFLLEEDAAQDGAVGSITLAAASNANNNFYNHAIVVITEGTGIGQARAINSYNGTSKVATIVPNWVTAPTTGSVYEILADTEKHVYEVHDDAISADSFVTDAIDANAFATDAAEEIRDAVWTKVIENSKTAEQILRIVLSALAEKSAGGGSSSVSFRNDADSKNRIVATVDASGNRTAITLDGT